MEIIQNGASHRLCLFSKGLIDEDEAKAVFEEITAGDQWAAFGVIAAEAELARKVRGAE